MTKSHRDDLKSNRFSKVLTSTPFRNAKYLKEHLARSELKSKSDDASGNFNCNSKRWKICKVLVSGDDFKSFVAKKT